MTDRKEYIERGALLRDIEETVVFSFRTGCCSAELRGAAKVTARINAAPAADVAEVVRCRNCKYSRVSAWKHWCHNPHTPWCKFHSELDRSNFYEVDADGFCSYGERKEGGNNEQTLHRH